MSDRDEWHQFYLRIANDVDIAELMSNYQQGKCSRRLFCSLLAEKIHNMKGVQINTEELVK